MSTIIIITVPTKPPTRLAEPEAHTLHVVGGELTKKQQREILRAMLKELRG